MKLAIIERPSPRPWRTIWFSPRLTIRRIIEAEVRPSWASVLVLSTLHFVIGSLEGNANGTVAAARSVVAIAWVLFDQAFYIIAGPFFATMVASWFGRTAAPSEMREALVWSNVPIAATLVLWSRRCWSSDRSPPHRMRPITWGSYPSVSA